MNNNHIGDHSIHSSGDIKKINHQEQKTASCKGHVFSSENIETLKNSQKITLKFSTILQPVHRNEEKEYLPIAAKILTKNEDISFTINLSSEEPTIIKTAVNKKEKATDENNGSDDDDLFGEVYTDLPAEIGEEETQELKNVIEKQETRAEASEIKAQTTQIKAQTTQAKVQISEVKSEVKIVGLENRLNFLTDQILQYNEIQGYTGLDREFIKARVSEKLDLKQEHKGNKVLSVAKEILREGIDLKLVYRKEKLVTHEAFNKREKKYDEGFKEFYRKNIKPYLFSNNPAEQKKKEESPPVQVSQFIQREEKPKTEIKEKQVWFIGSLLLEAPNQKFQRMIKKQFQLLKLIAQKIAESRQEGRIQEKLQLHRMIIQKDIQKSVLLDEINRAETLRKSILFHQIQAPSSSLKSQVHYEEP